DPPNAGPKELPPFDQIFVGDSLHHRYEVIRLLGCGWCGLVLLAYDHRINQHVAVKMIGRGDLREEAAGAEFRILIKVREKDPDGLAYIVRVLATFEHLGQRCIVTELLGPNLLDILDAANVILQTSNVLDSETIAQRKQTFSMDQIRAVASQLFKALTLLRKLGIVHGDIKPEVAPTEPPFFVRLIDFGTAGHGWAQKGMYLGTRFYRSPEIVWGTPRILDLQPFVTYDLGTNVTPAADMWSVGCLLAELYLGRPLFPARDEEALIEMVAYVLGPPPKKLTKGSVRRTALLPHTCQPRPGQSLTPAHSSLQKTQLRVDEGFVDLVAQCLEYDSKKRLTPSAGLAHPWVAAGIQVP
ncbi:kinase-like domain-containing protein, partial [Cladochytrium replicatum]